MKLTEPNQAYSILWDCLQPSDGESTTKKKRVTANHALELLENMYNTHNEERQTT